MSLPSYLFQRNQIWYFRQRIPIELVPICGRKEFKSSLKTRDAIVAKRRGVKLASRLWNQFEFLQRDLMKKDDNNFAELITLKEVVIGDKRFGEVNIDHEGDFEKEQATLNAFLNIISESKSKDSAHQQFASQSTNILLEGAITEYIANKREEVDNESVADEKTISATEGKLKRLVEFFGNVPVDTLLRKDAEKFRNTLLKLPKNMNKLRAYRGLSLHEVVALSPTDTLSTSTVKSYIEVASTFYKWCTLNEYAKTNPFESLRIKKPKSAKKEIEERDPWDHEQLTTIFSTPVYTHHEFKHNYHFWLPLIGLHTGARMNEICQLYHDDIVKIEGHLFFKFSEDRPDQKLKTRSSRRLIPVHQKLLAMNFEEYMYWSKEKGHDRLFQSLTLTRDGYSKNASNWFSRFRESHNLRKTDKKQDFHSFRHNVSDYFKQSDISDTQAAAILGHADQTITYGRYGKDLEASKLIELIEKLDFSEETSHVKPWKAQLY
ncbi:site-specific integrase [Alteromonas stellipolaris]|uniref:site-specific integrase n=1 Tax=Alteromonas stellipolaris TaxID=233316 RepID=UPI002494E2F8|nr:site-specific integrase [Alteromonas stellipolaris]